MLSTILLGTALILFIIEAVNSRSLIAAGLACATLSVLIPITLT